MDYKIVIADSWKYTQANKKLIYWFGFFPSIITTSVGIGYMTYQVFAFKKSFLFDDAETSFLHDVINFGWNFISTHTTLTIPLIIFAVIAFILWFLVPTIAEAATVQAAARSRNGQKSGLGIGLKHGLMAFLPLLELHIFIKTFGPFAIINEMGFVLRNLGLDLFKILLIPFIAVFILCVFLRLLFTYADLFVIIDDVGVFASLKKSAKLVILGWQETLLLTVLMLIIGARIIIQALLIFLIPALLLLAGGYIASLTLNVAVLAVFGVIGVAALILAAYLGGVVDVFSYTVWTFTFLELTSEQQVSARETARTQVIAPVQASTPAASASMSTGATMATERPINTPPIIKQNTSVREDQIPGLL